MQVKDIASVSLNIPLVVSASARCRRVRAQGPVDDDAPRPFGNQVDVELWAPPKHPDHPKIQSKVVHECPVGCISTICKPNKNRRHAQQPVVQVERGIIRINTFGNRGVGGDGGRCHESTNTVSGSVQLSRPGGITTEVMTAMLAIGPRCDNRNLSCNASQELFKFSASISTRMRP